MTLEWTSTILALRPLQTVRDFQDFLFIDLDLQDEILCLHCYRFLPVAHLALNHNGSIVCPIDDCDGTLLDFLILTGRGFRTRTGMTKRWPRAQDATHDDLIWATEVTRLSDEDVERLRPVSRV